MPLPALMTSHPIESVVQRIPNDLGVLGKSSYKVQILIELSWDIVAHVPTLHGSSVPIGHGMWID